MNKMNLQKNIIEQIKEAQIKLGFAREVIRLYYPISSLCALLEIEPVSAEQLLELLESSFQIKDNVLGTLKFAVCKGQRIEVQIPAEGAEYVHEHVEDPKFLVDIINLFSHGHTHENHNKDLDSKNVKVTDYENHEIRLDDICSCFAKYNSNYVCRKMLPDTDFDYVLYFPDGKPDEWYYCVKFEMNHAIYHRFTEEDYRNLIA